jgi:hypothetical protein
MSETAVAANTDVVKAPYDPSLFHRIAQRAQANYDAHVNGNEPLFRVEVPKGKLFDAYLNSLPAEIRQQMNCSCCRSFLNRSGGLVRISTATETFGQLQSVLWRDDAPTETDPAFDAAVTTMRDLVEKAAIGYHFLSSAEHFGEFEKGGFEHFAVINKQVFVHELSQAHEVVATEMQTFSNLSKFIGKDVTQDVLDKALVFFKHDARLKSQAKWIGHLEWLAEFKRQRDALPQDQRRAYVWLQVATQSPGRVDVKNSPLGKFIKNIVAGISYDVATKKFLEMTNGINYMRPTAAPKQGAVQRAEAIFEKMELAPSLERRELTHEEIRGRVWSQPVPEVEEEKKKPLFGHLTTQNEKPAQPEKLEINGGPITLQRFMAEILPQVEELYFDYRNHYSSGFNIRGFITAVHADAKPILMWDREDDRNPVSSYVYHNGSSPSHWGLPQGKVRITDIVINPDQWNSATLEKPFNFGEQDLVFIFETGRDSRLAQVGSTPMFPETFRPELHEVRSVMESFFRTKRMTPLDEGQKPVVGLHANKNGQMFIPLLVVTKDAIMKYQIDRSH